MSENIETTTPSEEVTAPAVAEEVVVPAVAKSAPAPKAKVEAETGIVRGHRKERIGKVLVRISLEKGNTEAR